jgi:DNA-binding transcriptional ArsR family regulator
MLSSVTDGIRPRTGGALAKPLSGTALALRALQERWGWSVRSPPGRPRLLLQSRKAFDTRYIQPVAILERAGLVSKRRRGRRKVVRTNLSGLRVARRLLDRYEELWRERVERMSQLISDWPKESDR